MTRNRREELSLRLRAMIEADAEGGRVAVYPVGEREAAQSFRHVRVAEAPPNAAPAAEVRLEGEEKP